jgi:hypothetical protein
VKAHQPLVVDDDAVVHGGTITLLDGTGLKVSGVSYTADQASREGWTIAF